MTFCFFYLIVSSKIQYALDKCVPLIWSLTKSDFWFFFRIFLLPLSLSWLYTLSTIPQTHLLRIDCLLPWNVQCVGESKHVFRVHCLSESKLIKPDARVTPFSLGVSWSGLFRFFHLKTASFQGASL